MSSPLLIQAACSCVQAVLKTTTSFVVIATCNAYLISIVISITIWKLFRGKNVQRENFVQNIHFNLLASIKLPYEKTYSEKVNFYLAVIHCKKKGSFSKVMVKIGRVMAASFVTPLLHFVNVYCKKTVVPSTCRVAYLYSRFRHCAPHCNMSIISTARQLWCPILDMLNIGRFVVDSA